MDGFEGIKDLIKRKEVEIIRRTNSGIHEQLEFKKILATLSQYNNERPVTGFLAILIKPSEVEYIKSDFAENIFKIIDNCILSANNHIIVNGVLDNVHFDKLQYTDGSQLKKVYVELSKDYCVFVISTDNVHYFVNGDDVGSIIFFTKEDQSRFNELKEIRHLNELFEEYRRHLTIRNTYNKFFVSNSGKKALHKHLVRNMETTLTERAFLDDKKQLLENKPEDRFREDLRIFLSDRLKGTVYTSKEHILESFKRIDIFIQDEYGDLYLIEVKWVGLSIHADGDKLGTEYNASNIDPAAIKQTIGYLMELFKHKKDVKIGYLVVFDARTEDLPDSIELFDKETLSSEEAKHYHRMYKVKDFKVINRHPY